DLTVTGVQTCALPIYPKPGRAFGGGVIQTVVPDVTIRAASDGSWHVELNPEGLPRVLVNQTYATRVSRTGGSAADKSFVANCLRSEERRVGKERRVRG